MTKDLGTKKQTERPPVPAPKPAPTAPAKPSV